MEDRGLAGSNAAQSGWLGKIWFPPARVGGCQPTHETIALNCIKGMSLLELQVSYLSDMVNMPSNADQASCCISSSVCPGQVPH